MRIAEFGIVHQEGLGKIGGWHDKGANFENEFPREASGSERRSHSED
jgi:hypothetical protein